MDIIDRKLIGKDLCGNECIDNNSVVHPETCASQILTECNGSRTLTEWIDGDSDPEVHHGSFSTYHSLIEWLNANYPRDTYSLPIATYSNITSPHIGGIMINPDHLTLSSYGVLDIDVNSLNIPTVNNGSYTTRGIVKIGNDTELNNDFSNTPIEEDSTINLPLRLDSNGRAGVAIASSLLSQDQSDWNQTNTSAVNYIKNKPTIPTVYNSTITFKQGSSTDTITLNQNSNKIIEFNDVEHYDPFTGATSEDDGSTGLVPAPETSDKDKFLKGDGSWDTPVSTTYTAGEGIDITEYAISQEIATSSTIGGVKIGYVENEELKPLLLDSNNKAYVNISNGSLKNHEVISINQAVYDEYGSHFDTCTVRCNISNEDLTIVNINDFKQVGNGYTIIQDIDVDDEYIWSIGTAGLNNTIGIINASSVSAKGCFQLTINHGNDIVETHNVGFIIDTPSNYAFAWFSTCSWAVSLYSGEGIGSNSCRVYLTAPSDFEGSVKISNIHVITHSGDNIGSMNGSTFKKWILGEPFTSGSVTAIAGTLVPTPQTYEGKVTVPTGYKVPVDAFVTLSSNPSVGDLLYDSEINDTLIHNLLTRVKSIELWIQNQQ